jgi:hypothetical protein
MKESIEEVKVPTREEAVEIVLELRQNTHAMGANDTEMPAFNVILGKLRNGEYSPKQAVEEARGILHNKEDYH